MTETISPWSELSTRFLSEGAWSVGQGPNSPDRQLFRAFLRRFARDYDGGVKPRLLEVGFGSGIDIQALSDDGLLSNLDYLGYDLTPEFVYHLRERFPDQRFEIGDVLTISKLSADIVWCRHVLEHVDDGYQALRNLWQATRRILLISWFIRPTWSEAEVRCEVSEDGFIHQHYSARRMIEFLGELGAHRYRFDIDHHATKASVWMLTREKEPGLCEEAHRFLASPRFLRSVNSVPRQEPCDSDALNVLLDATQALEHTASTVAGELLPPTLPPARGRARTFLDIRKPLSRYQRLVLWGFMESLDSMRHIMRHYAKAAGTLNLEMLRLPDTKASRDELRPGDLVIGVNVEGKMLRAHAGVDYVLHNFDHEHSVWNGLEEGQFLRLQVYTADCEHYGMPWDPVRRYDRESRTLFQPWGTDLLAEEFMEPVWNPESREAVFVGAVWGGSQGNQGTIDELKSVLANYGLAFRHLEHITDEENVEAVRSARLAPAFGGAWQAEKSYLPCRVFKNISYGQLSLTNVPKFRELFAGCNLNGKTVAETVNEALSLSGRDWREFVLAQQEIVKRYTYREALQSIGRALEEGRH